MSWVLKSQHLGVHSIWQGKGAHGTHEIFVDATVDGPNIASSVVGDPVGDGVTRSTSTIILGGLPLVSIHTVNVVVYGGLVTPVPSRHFVLDEILGGIPVEAERPVSIMPPTNIALNKDDRVGFLGHLAPGPFKQVGPPTSPWVSVGTLNGALNGSRNNDIWLGDTDGCNDGTIPGHGHFSHVPAALFEPEVTLFSKAFRLGKCKGGEVTVSVSFFLHSTATFKGSHPRDNERVSKGGPVDAGRCPAFVAATAACVVQYSTVLTRKDMIW